MGLLEGKNIVVTGVLTDASIAFGVAALAQQEGANVLLTGAGRALSLTERTARKLPSPAPVYELDVTVPEHLVSAREHAAEHFGGRVDGVLHAIAYGPPSCLGEDFMKRAVGGRVGGAEHLGVLLQGRRRSLPAADGSRWFVRRTRFRQHRRLARLQLDGRREVGAFESVSRYLARELGPQGIRSNLVAAGPIRTMAAKSIPGFKKFEDVWDERAPLGWDINDSSAVAKAVVALLSDWFPATTGSVVHVDGGYHAVGA